jgi:hypothetical protein
MAPPAKGGIPVPTNQRTLPRPANTAHQGQQPPAPPPAVDLARGPPDLPRRELTAHHTMAAVGSFPLIFGRTRSEEGKVVPPSPSLGLHGHPTTPSGDSEVEERGRGAVTAGWSGRRPCRPEREATRGFGFSALPCYNSVGINEAAN